MKHFQKLILFTFIFSSFLPLAASFHNLDSLEKVHIEAFENIPQESTSGAVLYLVETELGYTAFLAKSGTRSMERFISRDPLGYVDGYGLYNGYFAMYFGMDPSGLAKSEVSKTIEYQYYREDFKMAIHNDGRASLLEHKDRAINLGSLTGRVTGYWSEDSNGVRSFDATPLSDPGEDLEYSFFFGVGDDFEHSGNGSWYWVLNDLWEAKGKISFGNLTGPKKVGACDECYTVLARYVVGIGLDVSFTIGGPGGVDIIVGAQKAKYKIETDVLFTICTGDIGNTAEIKSTTTNNDTGSTSINQGTYTEINTWSEGLRIK